MSLASCVNTCTSHVLELWIISENFRQRLNPQFGIVKDFFCAEQVPHTKLRWLRHGSNEQSTVNNLRNNEFKPIQSKSWSWCTPNGPVLACVASRLTIFTTLPDSHWSVESVHRLLCCAVLWDDVVSCCSTGDNNSLMIYFTSRFIILLMTLTMVITSFVLAFYWPVYSEVMTRIWQSKCNVDPLSMDVVVMVGCVGDQINIRVSLTVISLTVWRPRDSYVCVSLVMVWTKNCWSWYYARVQLLWYDSCQAWTTVSWVD